MSKVLVCDRLFSRKVLDFFRFVSNNHNSRRICLSNMCPFLSARWVTYYGWRFSKSGAGCYWGGELRLNRTNTPKDQFLCQLSRKQWGLCSCLLPYKMVKFLGTIKSSPKNIYKIQHSREIWSSDVKLFKFRRWFHIFFIFSPIPGEMIQSDEHIFQMGWFNHHFCIDATLGRQVKMTLRSW